MPELFDPVDGENQAIRDFLNLYNNNSGITFGTMRKHLTRSGFPLWPEWVNEVPDGQHLNKLGAQNWLRYLFSLGRDGKPSPREAQTFVPVGWLVDETHFYLTQQLGRDHQSLPNQTQVFAARLQQPVGTVMVMGSYRGVPILGCVFSRDTVRVGDAVYVAPLKE